MREIKFRAWANNRKKMFLDSFTLNPEGGIASTFGIYEHNLTLMQYTGLKDKNGKEIYEGDIVEYPETSYPLIVKWDDEASCYYLKEISSGGAEPMPYKDSTEHYLIVIGNIYENPKLLESKKENG